MRQVQGLKGLRMCSSGHTRAIEYDEKLLALGISKKSSNMMHDVV